MSSPSTDRSQGRAVPRPPTEPVLAVTAAVSAALAQLLTDSGRLWVILDLAAAIAATAAVAMLLRAAAARRGRPWLAELGTAVTIAGLALAVLIVAVDGPESHLGAAILTVAAAMGAVLAVLVLVGAFRSRVRQERTGDGPAGGAADRRRGRAVTVVTLVAALIAVASVAWDAALR